MEKQINSVYDPILALTEANADLSEELIAISQELSRVSQEMIKEIKKLRSQAKEDSAARSAVFTEVADSLTLILHPSHAL